MKIDVHVVDLSYAAGTEIAVATRPNRPDDRVVMIHSGVTVSRYTQLLLLHMTAAERLIAVYHQPHQGPPARSLAS